MDLCFRVKTTLNIIPLHPSPPLEKKSNLKYFCVNFFMLYNSLNANFSTEFQPP